jgi:hypothetical protein
MLSTKLSDALRYPLKPINIVIMRLGELLPLNVVRGMSHDHVRDYTAGSLKFQMTVPQYVSQDVAKPVLRHMRIDPAGGGKNGDETGYAVTEFLNGNVFARKVGAIPGGFEDKDMKELAQTIKRWNPDMIDIEKNFGFGAFRKILEPYLVTVGWTGGITETFEGTNKEQRIIDTLEPIMGRGSLIFDEAFVLEDWESTQRHPMDKRQTYCLMQQIAKITRDPKCLIHDDRLDALAGSVGFWIKQLNQDSAKKEREVREAELAAKMADPFNKTRYDRKSSVKASRSVLRRR